MMTYPMFDRVRLRRFRATGRAVALAILALMAMVACSSKSSISSAPQIEVEPATLTPVIDEGALVVGETFAYNIRVYNTGVEPLTVNKPSLAYTPCASEEGSLGPAFTLSYSSDLAFPVELAPQGKGGQTREDFVLTVNYRRMATDCERTATLTIPNDDPEASRSPLVMDFSVSHAPSHITVPSMVDFGLVPGGAPMQEQLMVITNTGLGTLQVTGVRYEGAEGFSFIWRCPRVSPAENAEKPIAIRPTAATITDIECALPVVVAPNSTFEVPVRFASSSSDPARAFLTFYSNDPAYATGEGPEVELRANYGGPCLLARPDVVDFGSVVQDDLRSVIVDLYNCGDKPVHITNVVLSEDSSSDFSVDLTSLGGFSEASPLTLAPETTRTFVARYLPVGVDQDETGKIVPDKGVIVVTNDSGRPEMEVPLIGRGVGSDCPVAEFEMLSGTTVLDHLAKVPPQTRLELRDTSYDPMAGGGITSWEWTVIGPPGSADVPYPSPFFDNPTLELNVAGIYTIRLVVTNKLGISSCNTAEQQIEVTAGKGCHIELLWNTPNDPDQTDECGVNKGCGTDMDLHFVHPYAAGHDVDQDGEADGFFDTDWDCFWFKAHPVWVEGGTTAQQPNLDRDDTDGAGPENLNYVEPPDDKCYKVGVHYWDDHGYGGSYPTIRVYIDGEKKYERSIEKLNYLDMWQVGHVCCADKANPVREFSNTDGSPKVTPNYQSPDFAGGSTP